MMTMYWKDIRIIKASFILYFSWVPALYDSLQRPEHLHAGVEQRQHDAVLDGVVEGRVLLLNVPTQRRQSTKSQGVRITLSFFHHSASSFVPFLVY